MNTLSEGFHTLYQQGMRESNSHQRFWRPLSYHLTNPLRVQSYYNKSHPHCLPLYLQNCTHATSNPFASFPFLRPAVVLFTTVLWSSPHPISSGQLHISLCFHLRPIYLVVFKGVYFFRMGHLILRGASRLDAFSVYPFRTWLPGRRLGSLTGPPAARPSRSSRTKDSSSHVSCARAG